MANPFKGMGQLGGLLKQVQEMTENMKQLEVELAEARHEASSGGGLVTVVVTGKGLIESVKIKPEAIDPSDIETLEDLIVSAIRAAAEKADEERTRRVQEVSGGMDLPGIGGLGDLMGG